MQAHAGLRMKLGQPSETAAIIGRSLPNGRCPAPNGVTGQARLVVLCMAIPALGGVDARAQVLGDVVALEPVASPDLGDRLLQHVTEGLEQVGRVVYGPGVRVAGGFDGGEAARLVRQGMDEHTVRRRLFDLDCAAVAECSLLVFVLDGRVPEADQAREALHRIRECGKAAGLALMLDTAPQTIAAELDTVDAVVMIGTPLGTKGSSMHPNAPGRIAELRRVLSAAGREDIVVFADGGIRADTVPALAGAGADVVVAGSLLLGSADPAATSTWLRSHVPASPIGEPR